MKNLTATLFLGLIVAIASESYADKLEIEVWDVHYIDVEEAANSIKPALGPNGVVSVNHMASAIVVKDSRKNLNEARRILSIVDRKPKMYKIAVDFIEKSLMKELLAEIRFRVTKGGVSVASIPAPVGRNNVEARINAAIKKSDRKVTQRISILENREGRIFFGESHPITEVVTERWPHGWRNSKRTVYRDAGTSFVVVARRGGSGKINMSIVPEDSAYDKKMDNFRVRRTETTVVMDDPGRLVIGDFNKDETGSHIGILSGVGASGEKVEYVMIVSAESF